MRRNPGDISRRFRRGFGAVVVGSLVGLGCCTAGAGTLPGTATYRERIALPADAVFEAELQDVSRADAPATVLGRARLDPAGQPPFRFEIAYDDAAVQAGGRYSVRATVKQQDRLLFTTDKLYPVLDGREVPLEMLLVACGKATAETPLRGTYWKLVRLGDSEVAAPGKRREAHLVFAADELRVAGSGGCNRITGAFELDGHRLHFGRMAATMMACPDAMDLEQQFLRALEGVQGYRIRGRELELLDATGAVIARFEAVAPK